MEDAEGIVFDIEEFAVFDGPGIRTAVFLKGCPLRCNWCHNPEGLKREPQRLTSALCTGCGRCKAVCPAPDGCTACGACVPACPRSCIRIAGQTWKARDLARKIAANGELLKMNGGGVTFSGGECAMQTPFVLAVRRLLPDLHCAIETCGHAPEEDFRALIGEMDLVLFDIKHTDPALHRRYTGVDNALIRRNLQTLIESGVPFYARVPLIPGVSDTVENLLKTAQWIRHAKNLLGVELLPYHRSAGAKYRAAGMEYAPDFDAEREVNTDISSFTRFGIEARVL